MNVGEHAINGERIRHFAQRMRNLRSLGKPRGIRERLAAAAAAYLPVVSSRVTGYFPKRFILHPFVLSRFADSA